MRVLSTAWRAAGLTALAAVFLVLAGREAAAYCPPGCWVRLMCCCVTPCPVADTIHRAELEKILDRIRAANGLYGVRVPGLEAPNALKTPIDPAQLSQAGITASLQGWRNVLRGSENDAALGVRLAAPSLHLTEMEAAVQPPVRAAPNAAGIDTIENKAMALDESFWSTVLEGAESLDELEGLRWAGARISHLDALGYAMIRRNEIAEAARRFDGLVRRLNEATTLADDIRLNTELRGLVLRDYAVVMEMLGYVIQADSSAAIAADLVSAKPARQSTNAGIVPGPVIDGRSWFEFAAARAACEVAARRAVDEHNELTDVKDLSSWLPQLEVTVDEHEARKAHAWSMEQGLRDALATLYVDSEAAWRVLEAELRTRDTSSYMDQDRYDDAREAVGALLPELVAQKATTRFGKRRPVPCSMKSRMEGLCLPYTTAPMSGSWREAMSRINAYYAMPDRQHDAYDRTGAIDTRAGTQPQPPRGKDAGGSEPSLAASAAMAAARLGVAIQYRQEAVKRKLYWDAMRRGDGKDFGPTMSGALWTELVTKAPSCLTGPLPATPENLANRPGWFDVRPDCAWRTWSSGPNRGRRISHEELGGVDSAIWSIQNEIADYRRDHEGRDGVENWAAAADKLCRAAGDAARAVERADAADEIGGFLSALGEVRSDADNRGSVSLPN